MTPLGKMIRLLMVPLGHWSKAGRKWVTGETGNPFQPSDEDEASEEVDFIIKGVSSAQPKLRQCQMCPLKCSLSYCAWNNPQGTSKLIRSKRSCLGLIHNTMGGWSQAWLEEELQAGNSFLMVVQVQEQAQRWPDSQSHSF